MSPVREALLLPLVLLTVTLLGGVRVTERVTLVPPSLFALVLALILLGVLVRCGALAPERLMNPRRRVLANANGLVVLTTTFFASAQAFNLATPELGLPNLVFSVGFLVLLLNTLAAAPDRVRVLRSLMVIFGCAFALKFIVLAALADPVGGRLKRMLQVLLEGLTLGTLAQQVFHPATGYLAFFALVLFMVGLSLLPSRDGDAAQLHRQAPARRELPDW